MLDPKTHRKASSQLFASPAALDLKKVPVLAVLNEAEREVLGQKCYTKVFIAEEVIFSQGDAAESFFIIQKGKLRGYVTNAKDEVIHRFVLQEGDFFGEYALLNNAPRGATIIAETTVQCHCCDAKDFITLFGKERLKKAFPKRGAVSSERVSSKETEEKRETQKNRDTFFFLEDSIKRTTFAVTLDDERITNLVEKMFRIFVPAGTSIIKQGDTGDNFYIVERGNFHIYVKLAHKREKGQIIDSKPLLIGPRGRGESFGELALLYNSPRIATLTATEDSIVWAVDRPTFRRLLMKTTETRQRDYEDFLASIDIFRMVTAEERTNIAEALDEQIFNAGSTIASNDDILDGLYLIKKGEIVVMKTEARSSPEEVKRLHVGDYFGERDVLKLEKAPLTYITVSETVCLCLNRMAFRQLLRPLQEIILNKALEYELSEKSKSKELLEQQRARFQQLQLQEETLQLQRPRLLQESVGNPYADVKLGDLVTVGKLGTGSFGLVQLVKHPGLNQVFALKVIKKDHVVAVGQQDHILNEKKCMIAINCRFCIRLYTTYKDDTYLYFLQEVALGGELFSILRARTCFPEDTARFFTACVILAFESLHSHNIVYRDLKPENLLLDNSGYLKITDFGFAKYITDRTWTLCGTPDYLAPEVVSGMGHGIAVDWWTLGILLYEMLASYPPFFDEDPMRTYAKIMRGRIAFPLHFSQPAIDIIKKFLQSKPYKRLGMGENGIPAVKQHPFFKGFDWEALATGKMIAPIIPTVRSNEDLSNFANEYPSEQAQDNLDDRPLEDAMPGWDDEF